MAGTGDGRSGPPDSHAEEHRIRRRDARQRRLEREVFESSTRGLTRPLLRPRTGAPLRAGESEPPRSRPDPHAPNNFGGPIVLPPAFFTDDEMETF